jgi:DeoR/GlpR family transcriptional regulator of sugar metabolism
VLVEYDPLQEKVEALWNTGERKIQKIAEFLNVSEMTVRRRLKGLEERSKQTGSPSTM